MEATRFLDEEETLVVWESAEKGLRYPSRILDRYNETKVAFVVRNFSLSHDDLFFLKWK